MAEDDRPALLDLFCGAGGATKGYQRAGFRVVGVDINPQPNYCGDYFIQADAMDVLGTDYATSSGYAAIHASPPCQTFSRITGVNGDRTAHPDLLAPTRRHLSSIDVPWIIENVEDAPMPAAITLCGSSFGLNVRRHRQFEFGNWHPGLVPPCAHHWQTKRFRSLNKHGRLEGRLATVVGVYGSTNYAGEFAVRCEAMGIDWMTNTELSQAIPPAYTEWLGERLAAHLEVAA